MRSASHYRTVLQYLNFPSEQGDAVTTYCHVAVGYHRHLLWYFRDLSPLAPLFQYLRLPRKMSAFEVPFKQRTMTNNESVTTLY